MTTLPFLHLDALNMMRHYHGLHRLDLFIMSINPNIIHDLVDEGYCRKSLFSWQITRQGIDLLEEAGIHSFTDTRGL